MELKRCIIARLNDGQERYWKLNFESRTDEEIIGLYAIVQNRNSYDLVRIEGVAYVPEHYNRGHKVVMTVLHLPELDESVPF